MTIPTLFPAVCNARSETKKRGTTRRRWKSAILKLARILHQSTPLYYLDITLVLCHISILFPLIRAGVRGHQQEGSLGAVELAFVGTSAPQLDASGGIRYDGLTTPAQE